MFELHSSQFKLIITRFVRTVRNNYGFIKINIKLFIDYERQPETVEFKTSVYYSIINYTLKV